jgi:hypothetical protein
MTTRQKTVFVCAFSVLSLLAIPWISEAVILIGSDTGASWDWLTGANPLFVSPSQMKFAGLEIRNDPFNLPAFTGQVQVQATCCKDMVTKAPVTPAGVTVQITPTRCFVPNLLETLPPREIRRDFPLGTPNLERLPPCPATSGATVSISGTTSGSAFMRLSATTGATAGGYIATISATSPQGQVTKDLFFTVLPAAWPGDGSTCPAGLASNISLASLSPTPFVWKTTHAASTSYQVGVGFIGSRPGTGMEFKIVDPGGTGPLPRNVAIITFKNTKGWPVGLRTTNSAMCNTTGQQVTVAEGETKSISISTTSTTTLVFSKSSCRALINMANCWWGSALGLDDMAAFSTGPFWTLFGGRKVAIETVGDWGTLIAPNMVIGVTGP